MLSRGVSDGTFISAVAPELEQCSPDSGRVDPLRSFLIILYLSLALGLFSFTQVRQSSLSSFQFPLVSSKPYALVVGDNGHLFIFDGHQLFQFPTPTTFDLNHVRWRHDGAYALAVGDNNTLLKITVANGNVSVQAIPTPELSNSTTLQSITSKADDSSALLTRPCGKYLLFEVYSHLIRSSAFNSDSGIGLIAGQLGLTVIATQTKCDYNIFYNANAVCLSYKRIQYYMALNGTRTDLHRIGHFYDAGWMPGTQDAYVLGPALRSCGPQDTFCIAAGWTIAQITSSAVSLLSQDRNANYSLRSIDWQPTVRASNPQMVIWYMIASGGIGFTAIILVAKRTTLKEWLG